MLKLMSRRRRQAGAQAKAKGEMYENLFRSRCAASNIFTIQIPTGMRVRRGASGKLIPVPVQTPFDFILTHPTLGVAFIDVKVTDKATFPFSQLTRHQVAILHRTQMDKVPSGYAVLFEPLKLWVFFDADTLNRLSPRESLKPKDGLELGSELQADMTRIYSLKPQSLTIDK